MLLFQTQAYREGIFYPRYLFLFYGWYMDQFWVEVGNENLTCTEEQRERVISSALAPRQDEHITECSRRAETGIVSEHTMAKKVNCDFW